MLEFSFEILRRISVISLTLFVEVKKLPLKTAPSPIENQKKNLSSKNKKFF